ncbi:MAG: nuclease-related domain-containing protein [Anaerolineales bacterium]|nr:NERD domain-containing protein [Anaerolineales bacterium]MCS7249176.1 NERD domain-containing protein [Anaerolineales bacterium]MDW8162989.1 nuclease-related domain-containing protein [Anaerolineales bacterium]MDW8446018.1 nuclease-related domain-containing protein [Anaerolineales bacterium]
MKSIIDAAKVARRARFANVASLSGLLALLASTLLPYFLPRTQLVASLLLLVGLFTAMVGIYYANRWVRKPRPEAVLDAELKGLSHSYRLYHYLHKAADHLLLSPFGVTVLETVNLEGRFVYRNGRWREYMKLGRALRYIVEEHLGDPIKAALSSQAFLQRELREKIEGGEEIPVSAVVVFTHPRCVLELLEETPIPVVKAAQLKRVLPQKGTKLSESLYQRLVVYFGE